MAIILCKVTLNRPGVLTSLVKLVRGVLADKESGPRPIDNPGHAEDIVAPIVQADFCVGGGPSNGTNITLTAVTGIFDHRFNPPQTVGKTVLRLVAAKEQMKATADFINKLLGDLEAGTTPPAANTTLN